MDNYDVMQGMEWMKGDISGECTSAITFVGVA